MANPEHVALLRQGVEAWNSWRERNPETIPDLSGADLSGAILSRVNFSSSDLSWARLYDTSLDKANLRQANLFNADLSWARLYDVDLDEANLRQAKLIGTKLLRADLYRADFSQANLADACLNTSDLRRANLRKANLSGAGLSGADCGSTSFSDANLSKATLSHANLYAADLTRAELRDANLQAVQALETDFTAAALTGACLQDWNINHLTKLDDIDCQYVYLSWPPEKPYPIERCPSSGEFAPGQFTKLFQKVLSTVDLIFQNPDWEAFAYSFGKIQVENEDEGLEIQSIENKGDGVVVVRVSVSPNADKEKIHGSFMQSYESVHNLLMAQCEARIQDKDKEINRLFHLLNQANEKLGEVPKLMADSLKVQQTFNITGPVTNFAGNVEGDQYNYAPEQRQNLAEAAAEIQQLLYQLAQVNPTSTEVVAEAIHQEIKRNPTLKARLVSALKAGGLEALKAIFNHPLFSIPAETVKGWLEAE